MIALMFRQLAFIAQHQLTLQNQGIFRLFEKHNNVERRPIALA
jgi:hypothetical protein